MRTPPLFRGNSQCFLNVSRVGKKARPSQILPTFSLSIPAAIQPFVNNIASFDLTFLKQRFDLCEPNAFHYDNFIMINYDNHYQAAPLLS